MVKNYVVFCQQHLVAQIASTREDFPNHRSCNGCSDGDQHSADAVATLRSSYLKQQQRLVVVVVPFDSPLPLQVVL